MNKKKLKVTTKSLVNHNRTYYLNLRWQCQKLAVNTTDKNSRMCTYQR